MPVCNAVQANHEYCTAAAKADSPYCGRHKDHLAETNLERLRQRIMNTVNWFDHQMIYGDRLHALYHEISVYTEQQLRTKVTTVETRLLETYGPGFRGPFVRRNVQLAQDHRLHGVRREAELRVPVHLRGRMNLLHDWIGYLDRNLRLVIDDLRLDGLYDPTYVVDVVTPILVALWNDVVMLQPIRGTIIRAVRQLFVMGQRYLLVMLRTVDPAAAEEAIRPAAAAAQPAAAGAGAAAGLPARNPAMPLRDFTQDRQNLHRSAVVEYVTTIFNKLMEVRVPEGQKTLAGVFEHCTLPADAAILMVQLYTRPASIYEIPNAYPRALDAVWAYISSHPEKTALCARITHELTDNIGMCLQGNLSRLCNIVSGYIDGVQPMVPTGETLQNRMAALAADALPNKIPRAREILRELAIPEGQWNDWLDALPEVGV